MGVCAPWPIDDELCPCDLPDGTDPELLAHWQEVASDILWVASGRRWGPCEVVLRPCVRRCGGGSGLPVPYKGPDGEWRNWTCGCPDDCSCTALSEVILPGPVASITEVTLGGDTLDPADYRLDKVGSGWRLVRLDGVWPDCQDMNAACGEEGSWCITYQQGIALDALAIAAVTELTCEMTKACIPGCKTCRLPKNIQATTRRGVTVTFDTAKSWLHTLPLVNAFLAAVNPKGLSSAPSVWSPDVSRPRTTPPVEVS